MQEKPIHNKYNGNKNTKNKNFNRHRSTHKNYKNTKGKTKLFYFLSLSFFTLIISSIYKL